MPWPGFTLRFFLLFLLISAGPPCILADGNVGCLFSDSLCLEDVEWCFDDYAFGRCLPSIGNVEEEDLYRYSMDRPILHNLSHELKRLFALGYRWSHAYTQCRLQGMLFAAKNDMDFEENACTHLVDQDLEGALKALEGEDQLNPQEVAIVKYTPSVDDPHAAYADEVYYPPVQDSREAAREIIMPKNAIDIYDMEDPYAQYEVIKRNWIPQMHRRSFAQIFSKDYNTPGNFRRGKETRDDLEFLPDFEEDDSLQLDAPPRETQLDSREMNILADLIDGLKNRYDLKQFTEISSDQDQYDDGFSYNKNEIDLQNLLKNEILKEREEKLLNEVLPERFTVTYNTPDGFRAGWEARDVLREENDLPESRVYFDEDFAEDNHQEEYGSGSHNEPEEIFRELQKIRGANPFIPKTAENGYQQFSDLEGYLNDGEVKLNNGDGSEQPKIYTEGGIVYVPDSRLDSKSSEEDALKQNIEELLEGYDFGFKRRERLDVKKPGPPFDRLINTESKKAVASKYVINDMLLPSMMKKGPRGAHPNPAHEVYDVDTDYVFVTFKNSVNTWKQGDEIIRNISDLLKLDPREISHGRVDRNEVTFRVGANKQNLNASEVARRIDSIKEDLKKQSGVEITSAGVGDKTKLQTVFTSKNDSEDEFYIIVFTVCGVLGAMIIASVVLLIIRKHVTTREKLHGLTRPDSEASKDYQDLCRARMASKSQQPAETVHGRITSLSRESEQSPSSRSSTSSWSEEPTLHNMDISTGHMVLSYMEDHLRNKDRLEQEWVALCAYVAEPCETSVALKKENVEKNRYPDVMPYDHSRVVLNELSNAAGSDYINASTITDHDPRNPAYIATQGPLPHTAPDFWQLIWEQGAVVIVMLTRLTEGGAAMCHRYWPEEGSELYHIYEVHLVSEHIWCDDYLVRSFYLKNVRTGETRTVTQFHFLSWPEAGVPSSTKALLEFRRKVNKSYRGRSCPIVVHCSDGAGRTGTYCLIDMVLSRMAKGAKEIDIAATLEHLRDQRVRMVATKQQFEFVLTAVAEEVHAILKALPPQPTPTGQHDKEKS